MIYRLLKYQSIILRNMSMNTQNIEKHILNRFNIIKLIGSGAYGHVWKIQEKTTQKIFALKKIFDAFQHATDAQRTYREIEILKQLDHPNIIKLYETIKAQNNRDVYLIFQYMETDLHKIIGSNILKDIHIKFIIYQLAKALKYLHSGNIIHRDLKPSNILINSDCTIKICDFGLVRSLKTINKNYVLTQGVATRWYRSPQILLGSKSYSTPADIWSFGCIIYQILLQTPIFQGNSTMDQLQKICSLIGYPNEEDQFAIQSQISRSLIKQMKLSGNNKLTNNLKPINPLYKSLLDKMMIFNPKKRIIIEQILKHQLLNSFYKESDQIVLFKEITTPLDDNKKISVDQYRRLIYGEKLITNITPKNKYLSSSLGSGFISPKYNPTNVNQSIGYPSSHVKKDSSQGLKKLSLLNMKYSSDNNDKKTTMHYKPDIKYMRSATNIMKNVQSPFNNQCKYFRKESNYNAIHNQEELDHSDNKLSSHIHLNEGYKEIISQKQAQKKKFHDSISRKYKLHSHQNSQMAYKTTLNPSKTTINKMILSEQQIKQKLTKYRSLKNDNLIKFHIYEVGNKAKTPANTGNYKIKNIQ